MEPVKLMRSTPGCSMSACPASGPVPWTTLNAPGGTPARAAISASSEHERRRPLRGLEDDGVAGGQGRADLPRREDQRGVPGRDERRDAGRLVMHVIVGDVAADGLVRRRCERARRRTRCCARPGPHALEVADEQRAVVDRLHDRELLLVFEDSLREAVEDSPSTDPAPAPPRPERRFEPRGRPDPPPARRRPRPLREPSRRWARTP